MPVWHMLRHLLWVILERTATQPTCSSKMFSEGWYLACSIMSACACFKASRKKHWSKIRCTEMSRKGGPQR